MEFQWLAVRLRPIDAHRARVEDSDLLELEEYLIGGNPAHTTEDEPWELPSGRYSSPTWHFIYEEHPLTEKDAWGDLDSFRAAASAS